MNFDLFCWLVGLLWLIDLSCYLPLFSVFFGKIEERGYEGENPRYTLRLRLKLAWLASALALMFAPRFRAARPALPWRGCADQG